ncbi:hypothetical protein Tco_1475516 [Tanacetum coccineum]
MDQILKHGSVQGTNDHKRKFDDRRNATSNNNNYRNNNCNNDYHQQQNRRQESVRTHVATSTKNKKYTENKRYAGKLPWKTKRKDTKISHSSGPTILVADETVHEERGDSVKKAATTATSLDAEQGSGNINRTQSTTIPNVPFPQGISSGGSARCQEAIGDTIAQTRSERISTPSYDSPLLGVNTPRSDEERIELKELMDMCTKLSDRVLDLENVNDAQALEIKKLKNRVKKLEKKKKSSTPQLKRRLFKVRIESSAEKKDAETHGSAPVATTSVSVSTAEPSIPPTATTTFTEDEDLTIAQTLMKMRKASETATRPIVSPQQRPIVPPQQQLDPKDKGKGIILQAELDEEVWLEREKEEEASNVALIEEWDSIEARIDVDA